MQKPGLLLIGCLLVHLTNGQPPQTQISERLISSIKNDVWIPFMEAYRDLDGEKLRAIHCHDIYRITVDQNKIEQGSAYLDTFTGFLKQVRENQDQVRIAFSIRTTARDELGQQVYQTGYYRFSHKGKDEDDFKTGGYGYFQVALRREDNRWKLAMDSDKMVELSDQEFLEGNQLYILD